MWGKGCIGGAGWFRFWGRMFCNTINIQPSASLSGKLRGGIRYPGRCPGLKRHKPFQGFGTSEQFFLLFYFGLKNYTLIQIEQYGLWLYFGLKNNALSQIQPFLFCGAQ